jgi:hypothetical protein
VLCLLLHQPEPRTETQQAKTDWLNRLFGRSKKKD